MEVVGKKLKKTIMMKRIALILFFLFSASISLHAQDVFFTDSLRIQLIKILVDKNIAIHTKMLNYDPLIIRDIISMKNLSDNSVNENDDFGIYDFRSEKQILDYSLIFIRDGDEFEILDLINKNRSKIKSELKTYFHRHPEVPKKLFRLYVDAVLRVKREYLHLERIWGIRIEKDGLNDDNYRFINKSSGNPLELEEIIN
jgi:hypothetical protein